MISYIKSIFFHSLSPCFLLCSVFVHFFLIHYYFISSCGYNKNVNFHDYFIETLGQAIFILCPWTEEPK